MGFSVLGFSVRGGGLKMPPPSFRWGGVRFKVGTSEGKRVPEVDRDTLQNILLAACERDVNNLHHCEGFLSEAMARIWP